MFDVGKMGHRDELLRYYKLLQRIIQTHRQLDSRTQRGAYKAHLHDKRFGHGTPENGHPCPKF